jgi:hypothetical protein
MAKTRAQTNKAIRQEALREQLAAQGHLQHVFDLQKKLEDLDTDLDSTQVQRIRASLDSKIKLMDKYLPTLKQQDIDINADVGVREIKIEDA